MPSKGQSKNCCCDGCSSPPWGNQIGDTIFLEQHLCCACVPLQIVGAYRNAVEAAPVLFLLTLGQTCENNLPENAWSGKLVFGSQVSDVTISLLPDLIYGKCYLELSSQALGIYGNQVEIDDAVRSVMCSTCQSCPNEMDTSFAVFNFDDPVNGSASLTLSRAPNTSLTPTGPTYGCSDPCDGFYPPLDPYSSCGGPCDGCGCLCTKAFLYVQEIDQNGAGSSRVVSLQMCDNSYISDISETGWQVSVVPDDATCCALALTGVGDYQPRKNPEPVAIGINTGNPCPNPTASWMFEDSSDPYNVKVVNVYFACAGCDGRGIGVSTSCCDQPLPEVLQCEVIITPGCMCPHLGEIDVGMDLLWNNGGHPGWSGTWSKDCGPPPFPYGATVGSVFVEVGCSGRTFTCRIIFLEENDSPISSSSSCDPLDATFVFTGFLTGESCGSGGQEIPYSATVKVMG